MLSILVKVIYLLGISKINQSVTMRVSLCNGNLDYEDIVEKSDRHACSGCGQHTDICDCGCSGNTKKKE